MTPAAAVFGGYGTFGAHVCRELARMGIALAVVGRDDERARAFAAQLGPAHVGLAGDARDPRTCLEALRGRAAAVLCAGPFDAMGEALLAACLEAGSHYVDIAEDRRHAARVREWGPRFAGVGLFAVYGCSSLPGISSALALAAAEGVARPRRARVSLFIGNDNPKGFAAIRTVLGAAGRPFRAPQGTLRALRRRETIALPVPYGPRPFYDLESPEYDLLPDLLGLDHVTVKVGFEWDAANRLFSLLPPLAPRMAGLAARALAGLAGLAPRWGSSGGVVMAEVLGDEAPGGEPVRRWAAAVARQEGQRMAALPCALVARALLGRDRAPSVAGGAGLPHEILGAKGLLDGLAAEGFEVVRG